MKDSLLRCQTQEIARYLKVPVSSFFEEENQIDAIEKVFDTLKILTKERMEK